MSRRHLLLGAFAAGLAGCPAGDPVLSPPPAQPANPPGSAPDPSTVASTAARASTAAAVSAPAGPAPATPPLDVVRLGSMRDDERGGLLVVLLHGWRAHGDDLVPLARELVRPRVRFLVPAAPLAEPNGGLAWWRLDAERPAHAWKDELPAQHQPSASVSAARAAVQALLRESVARYAPDQVALAGFSQGAMLALDVALAADPPVDRVAALSGVLLADSLPALHRKRGPVPKVFVSHGRRDPVLPFEGGASIPTLLEPYGYSVQFSAFDGGHAIPAEVVAGLRRFLFE